MKTKTKPNLYPHYPIKPVFLIVCALIILFFLEWRYIKHRSSSTRGSSTSVSHLTPIQETLLQPHSQEAILNEIIELHPLLGYHFNLKAPQKCAEFVLLKITPRTFTCQIQKPGNHPITVSLCDDAETFCKVEKFNVVVLKSTQNPGLVTALSSPPKIQPALSHSLPHFITNDPKKALELAQKEKKLLLIDFFGIWCPPCNLLDEHVFNFDSFQWLTQDMIKVRLDADSTVSWEWKEHFKVGGYPTVIIANEKLEEIGRLMGYRPRIGFEKWVETQKKFGGQSIESLLKQKKPDATAQYRIASWHLERYEFQEVVNDLKDTQDASLNFLKLKALLKLAELAEDGNQQLAVLKNLIQSYPESIELGEWVATVLELNLNEGAPLAQRAFDHLNRWRKNPELENQNYTAGDLLFLEALLEEKLGKEKEAKNFYAQAADYYLKLAKESKLSVARGANLEAAHYLHKAGKTDEAKKLFESLSSTYTQEFTFNFNYASLLHDLKDNTTAKIFAQKALENSYGDNWLRSIELLAKIEIESGAKEQAKKLIDKTLAETLLPASYQIRTHKYIAKLRKLKLENGI